MSVLNQGLMAHSYSQEWVCVSSSLFVWIALNREQRLGLTGAINVINGVQQKLVSIGDQRRAWFGSRLSNFLSWNLSLSHLSLSSLSQNSFHFLPSFHFQLINPQNPSWVLILIWISIFISPASDIRSEPDLVYGLDVYKINLNGFWDF
jgi:hypothetical protein